MANDSYSSEISPKDFLRVDEEEAGMMTNPGFGPPIRLRGKKRLASNGRDKITMAEMKAQISALWKEGDTYAEIATRVSDEFNLEGDDRIGAHGVQYHIKTLLETARKQSLLHINERQALVLARYDQIEMLATEAYFASMSSDTTNYERMVKKAQSKDRAKQLADDLKRERKRVEKINLKRTKDHRKLLVARESDPILGDMPDLLETTQEQIKEYKRTEDKPAGDPRFLSMLIDINEKRAKLWNLLNRNDVVNPDQELAKLPDEERRARMSAVLHTAMARRTNDTGALARPSPLGGFAEGEAPVEIIQMATEEEIDAVDNPVEWEFD